MFILSYLPDAAGVKIDKQFRVALNDCLVYFMSPKLERHYGGNSITNSAQAFTYTTRVPF